MKNAIVVIEDNEQNMYLMTFILEKHGYRVLQAREGRAGVDLVKSTRPDLVLLDIQLPGMDGYAVARELRAEPSLASLPIIAITSYAMVGDREKGMEAGCTGYIEKPINPDTILAEIEVHLKPENPGGSR